jgi:hypothetical protein
MMIMALAFAASTTSTYDCILAKPLSIKRKGDAVESVVIGFPGLDGSPWKFQLTLAEQTAEISWPDSPMQLSGKADILPTAKGAGAIILASGGPCLFTEQACGGMVNFAKQPDDTVDLLVMPTALATDEAKDTRRPFLAMIDGHCEPRKATK